MKHFGFLVGRQAPVQDCMEMFVTINHVRGIVYAIVTSFEYTNL